MAKKKLKNRPNSPVTVHVVNCDSASPVSDGHVRRMLRAAGKDADVVLACECFRARAGAVLGDFHVSQFGAHDTATAGGVVAVRKTRGHIQASELILGMPAWLAKGVRDRYWNRCGLRIDDMKVRQFSAGHPPPKRAWARWAAYMLKAPRGVLGMDANKLKRAVKPMYPLRKVRQIALMCLVVPAGIPASEAKSIDIGGDHEMLKVVLWPKQ